MKVDLFNYNLPDELIAQSPVEPRDLSRLLVLNRQGKTEHRIFKDIVDLIPNNSLLIFNDTKVIPARLFGNKSTGGKIEFLLTHGTGNLWKAIYKSSRPPKSGDFVTIYNNQGKTAKLEVQGQDGREIILRLPTDNEQSPWEFLDRFGHIPLPPYIKRKDNYNDKTSYQTVYAKNPGAVAAPTAGLHFTSEILDSLKQKGVQIEYLTLHVGIGTFTPVKVEDTDEHKMHSEYFEISEKLAHQIKTLSFDAPIISVGTTSLRALEGASIGKRLVKSGTGSTDIFITPGYKFKVVDSLITNFHLPKSTLIMLVSAFRGRESILNAYNEAVNLKYRFFSYGDAMYMP